MFSFEIVVFLLAVLVLVDFLVMKQFKKKLVHDELAAMQRKAERMRKEFSSNVTHELKSPLHLISAYSEIIANGTASYEEARQFALKIHWESHKMRELIDEVISLSQLDEINDNWKNVRKTDIIDVARCALDMNSATAELKDLTLRLEGGELNINTNRRMVCSIIHNLCSNSVKYTNPGGIVKVQVRGEGSPDPVTGLYKGAFISVIDNGIGIAPEDQKRVFERFYRADKSHNSSTPGNGLGLSIVDQAVRQLGGTLKMDSALGKGTAMNIYLPSIDTFSRS